MYFTPFSYAPQKLSMYLASAVGWSDFVEVWLFGLKEKKYLQDVMCTRIATCISICNSTLHAKYYILWSRKYSNPNTARYEDAQMPTARDQIGYCGVCPRKREKQSCAGRMLPSRD